MYKRQGRLRLRRGVAQFLAPQEEPCGDGRAQQHHGAHPDGDVQAVDEAVLSGLHQGGGLVGGQVLGGLHGAAERFAGGGLGARGDAGGRREVAVDAGDDGAEQGDAEGRAEFVGRLGDRRGGAGLLLGDAGEDDIGGDGEGEARADADDEEDQADRGGAGVGVQGGGADEREPDDGEAAGHDEAYGQSAGDIPGGESGADRADRGGKFGEPGVQRRAHLDHLEELGEEEDQPGQAEDGQQIGQYGAGEAPVVKELHVEQGGVQAELAAYEDEQRKQADQAGGQDVAAVAVDRRLLDGVDDAHDAHQGQRDAGDVPGAGIGMAGFGDHPDADDDQEGHHRKVDQEDRAPPEVAQQKAAEDRADGGTGRGHRAPYADREAALLGVVEEVADQRQGGRHQRRTGHTQQGAGGDHHLRGGGVRTHHRQPAERDGADQQQFLAADAVAEAAHGDQETGDDEGVDVADPQQLGARRLQILTQERGGQAEDRGVDADQQDGEDEDGEGEPAARSGLIVHMGRTGRSGRCGLGHFSMLRRMPPSSSSAIEWLSSPRATRPSWTAQAAAPIRP